jgi:CheY-like chemotaxis protein
MMSPGEQPGYAGWLIFISAEKEPANAARARELGALAYLTKPFDSPALTSLVAGAFAHAR